MWYCHMRNLKPALQGRAALSWIWRRAAERVQVERADRERICSPRPSHQTEKALLTEDETGVSARRAMRVPTRPGQRARDCVLNRHWLACFERPAKASFSVGPAERDGSVDLTRGCPTG